jgi:hypothetical protein
VTYLSLKGLNLGTSKAGSYGHQPLHAIDAVFQSIEEATMEDIHHSAVTKYRQRQFTSILVDRPGVPVTIVIDQAILDALEHYPFSSIQELARPTCISTTTVH